MTHFQETALGAVAPGRSGRMLVQIITPGTGSSGVYSEAVLKDAAERRVFAKGTQMFADHPSVTEAQDRPERSIKDLAGVLAEDAYWDGAALVAEVKTFDPWKSVIAEMHDAIGVSIRAAGTVNESDDAGNPIIASLDEALSVDFVTKAGRGGAIRELYEAARNNPTPEPPSTPGGNVKESDTKEHTMELTESQYAELTEKANRVEALEAERDTAITRAEAAEKQVAEAQAAADMSAVDQIIAEAAAHFTALETAGLKAQITHTEGRVDLEAFKTVVAAEAASKNAEQGDGTPNGVGPIVNESSDISDADLIAALTA